MDSRQHLDQLLDFRFREARFQPAFMFADGFLVLLSKPGRECRHAPVCRSPCRWPTKDSGVQGLEIETKAPISASANSFGHDRKGE